MTAGATVGRVVTRSEPIVLLSEEDDEIPSPPPPEGRKILWSSFIDGKIFAEKVFPTSLKS